jgi:ribosome-interacting GTPase 1
VKQGGEAESVTADLSDTSGMITAFTDPAKNKSAFPFQTKPVAPGLLLYRFCKQQLIRDFPDLSSCGENEWPIK